MLRHWFKMNGAPCFVICHNWRWHVQQLWNGRVEFPHKINVIWNAHDFTLNFCCLSTSNVVRMNLTSTTHWSDCVTRFLELLEQWKFHHKLDTRNCICSSHLHWISSSTVLLSPSPSEFVQMQIYWPIWLRLTFVITKLWFEIIIPSLNEFKISRP